MALKDIPFTDLLLSDSGDGRLRGIPGQGQRMVPVPESCREEVRQMPPALRQAWLSKNLPAIRFEHHGVFYRVSHAPDINFGQCWFLRRMPSFVPSLEQLEVPNHIGTFLMHPAINHGLILFCGSQGSGKTTLASSLIKSRLTRYGGLAVTFESPAEMPLSGYYGDWGQCIQAEVPSEDDLPNLIQRSHMFAAPNIIFIGEIKSAIAAMESLRASLGSKEQMVIATIHGTSPIAALQRLLLWGKELDGANSALNLSMSLTAIIQLSLENEDDRKKLRIPEFLLIPYSGEFALSVRAKIKAGTLQAIEQDMNRQKGIIMHLGGVNKFLEGNT